MNDLLCKTNRIDANVHLLYADAFFFENAKIVGGKLKIMGV